MSMSQLHNTRTMELVHLKGMQPSFIIDYTSAPPADVKMSPINKFHSERDGSDGWILTLNF